MPCSLLTKNLCDWADLGSVFQEYLLGLSCLDSLVFGPVIFSRRSQPLCCGSVRQPLPCPGLTPAPGAVGAQGLVLALWRKNTLPWLWMKSDTTVLKVP